MEIKIEVLISPDSFSCPKCNRDFLVGDLKYYNGSEYICLGCAELDYLIYLPSGNHCLTRRAQKYSKVSANVYRQNKSKHRYERKGTLVEKNALSTAEKECEKDSNYREEHRKKAKVYRDKKELQYRNNFAKKIRNLFHVVLKMRNLKLQNMHVK
jgi:hypothetical protein